MTDNTTTFAYLADCAKWLHRVSTDLADADVVIADVDSVSATLQDRTTRVAALAHAGECSLPVKDALQLQLAAQDAWNATVLLTWPTGRAELKRRARLLAVFLFLFSHQVFAPLRVFEAHIAHRPRDGEACVLMCLKVSKALVRAGDTADAQQMLSWAAAVARACCSVQSPTQWQLVTEVMFAQLHVRWKARDLAEACETAESLVAQTEGSGAYREALVEFIFEAAVAALQTDDAAQCPPPPGERPMANSVTGEALHAAVQRLLRLSLRVQRAEKVRTVKQQSSLGMTELQLSCSLLVTGAYAKAADEAALAQRHLQTFEPLIVRLRAAAHCGDVDVVVQLFEAVCAHNAIHVPDLCAVAAGVVELIPSAQERMCELLQRRLATEQSVDHRFRFLCLLLHTPSEWSVSELLRHLASDTLLDHGCYRFFFTSLWQLAVTDERASGTQPTGETGDTSGAVVYNAALPTRLRWECLSVALERFAAACASTQEFEVALLDLSRLAIEVDATEANWSDSTQPSTAAVQRAWERWQLLATDREVSGMSPVDPAASLVQAQLAFLLGLRHAALQHVDALLAAGDGDDATPACTAVIHFLLERSLVHDAGEVAHRCVARWRLGEGTSERALDVAKVCAVGFLASDDSAAVRDLTCLFATHVCPRLLASGGDALSAATVSWWCHVLWYMCDRLLAEAAATAAPAPQVVRLSHTAVFLYRRRRTQDAEDAEKTALRRRACALLEGEFDLFVVAEPILTLEELQQHYTWLASCPHATDNADEGAAVDVAEPPPASVEDRQEATLLLTQTEITLRRACEHRSPEADAAALVAALEHLRGLPKSPVLSVADLEQAAQACNRAATASPQVCVALQQAAVTLQLAAATHQHLQTSNAAVEAVTAGTLSMLYDAYRMAHDADTRALVFETLASTLLQPPEADASVPLSLVLEDSGHAPPQRVPQLVRLIETMVEFFAVEAWNATVQWNVLQRREHVRTWRTWAMALIDLLDDATPSKVAIQDLDSQVPLL